MSTNAELAAIFRETADLLDVLGERFKPEAYRRAARSIESLTEDLRAVAARDELRAIPGVGDAIAEKTREFLATGHVAYHDRLLKEVPPGLLEIVGLPGLGPKTARRFWTELAIEGPAELAAAIGAGRLTGVKGFGPKKIAQIRAALAARAASGPARRLPLEVAYPIATRLLAAVRGIPTVERAELAGSFRRAQETVGDLDLLVTSTRPEPVFDAFSELPEVRQVRLRGPTKETVLLDRDLQVDLRVVEPAAFGAALQYFTGSKDHNVTLRTLARDRGLKINEYGVFRGEERVAGRTEEEVYAALGLAWIPPELRVDRGEIAAAAHGPLPPLVTDPDLAGELHLHLSPRAPPAELAAALADAVARGYRYVGVVVAGTERDGTIFRLPPATLAAGPARAARTLEVHRVVEVGPGPPDPELAAVPCDYRLLRPVGPAPPGPPDGSVRGLVHLGFGEGGRPVAEGAAWIEAAARRHLAVEVGPGPERLDSNWARTAREAGASLSVPTGLGASGLDPTRPVALGFARRAGATPAEVANARPTAGLRGPSGR